MNRKIVYLLILGVVIGSVGVFTYINKNQAKAREICASNLMQIGMALHMYDEDNDGKFPDDIMVLLPNYVDFSKFVCPGYRTISKIRETSPEILISYIYVKGLSIKDKTNSIVLYDASVDNHGGRGRNVLFVSGGVGYYSEEDFQTLLQKFLSECKTSVTLTEVKIPELKKSLDKFEKTYVLSALEDFKYINPPLRPEPGADNMFFMWSKEGLEKCGEGFGHITIKDVLHTLADIYPYEIEGVPELLDTKIPGDFIFRIGTPQETIVKQLEKGLQRKLKMPVKFVYRDVTRTVTVAEGTFNYTPIVEHQPYVSGHPYRIELYGEKLNEDLRAGGGGCGNFEEFLKWIGMYIGRYVISNVNSPPPDEILLCCHDNDRHKGANEDELVLKHLTEQTGLRFREEIHTVRVLFVEQTDWSPFF